METGSKDWEVWVLEFRGDVYIGFISLRVIRVRFWKSVLEGRYKGGFES